MTVLSEAFLLPASQSSSLARPPWGAVEVSGPLSERRRVTICDVGIDVPRQTGREEGGGGEEVRVGIAPSPAQLESVPSAR